MIFYADPAHHHYGKVLFCKLHTKVKWHEKRKPKDSPEKVMQKYRVADVPA
jgi:hypothetical protein